VRARRLSCFVLLAVACVAEHAHADEAGRLFDRGLKDMLAQDYDRGCELIAQSQQLDPRPGTLFTLAECYRKAGKLASAVQRYDEYLALYETLPPKQKRAHKERQEIVIKDRGSLLPVVPRVLLVLPENAPKGTVVMKDGVVLEHEALKQPLLVDPGAHVIVTQAPGGTAIQQRATIQRGEERRIDLMVGAAAANSEGPPQTPPPAPSSGPESDGEDGPQPEGRIDSGVAADTGSSQRTWGWVLGGLGAAGVAVGAVTGAVAWSQARVIESHCRDGADSCDPGTDDDADRAKDQAKKFGAISTIGFGVGLPLLATGVVLLLTAPSKARPQAALVPVIAPTSRQGGLLGVTGRF